MCARSCHPALIHSRLRNPSFLADRQLQCSRRGKPHRFISFLWIQPLTHRSFRSTKSQQTHRLQGRNLSRIIQLDRTTTRAQRLGWQLTRFDWLCLDDPSPVYGWVRIRGGCGSPTVIKRYPFSQRQIRAARSRRSYTKRWRPGQMEIIETHPSFRGFLEYWCSFKIWTP